MTERIREIPYNYTSFSDREIVIRLMGEDTWTLINELRGERRTGRSARMLYEVLGDIWVIKRNPFIQDDLLENPKRKQLLIESLHHRLHLIDKRADDNRKTLDLIESARGVVAEFESWLISFNQKRSRIDRKLRRVSRRDNVDFSGLARVSHTTDATDWRVEYPMVVLKPDSEKEVAEMVAACIESGLTVIPRGGGTGYTGGAIPLYEDTAVINLEKLDKCGEVLQQSLPGNNQQMATIKVEAGVVTKRVAECAAAKNLAFAVDPTSQNASTIGGNIAMNAGGKKAVIWGTTIDNLLRWKMVTADANWLEVTRINHNAGKIHTQQTVEFEVRKINRKSGKQMGDVRRLSMPGNCFRKEGLGKDVTDKFLSGLPGVQKEGCDGIVTSAEFILHRLFEYTHTLCLEFFNQDSSTDVAAIVEIKHMIDTDDSVQLAGLEHLDARYIRAVKYSTKANRADHPRMLLIADIASQDIDALNRICSQLVDIANQHGAEGFIATSPEAQDRFWADRKRTAAISAHTNAFKINEDVVIPLENLSRYSRGIEVINIRQSIGNKISIARAFVVYLDSRRQSYANQPGDQNELIISKIDFALDLIRQRIDSWQFWLDHLEEQVGQLESLILDTTDKNISIIDCLLQGKLRAGFRKEIRKPLEEVFGGLEFETLRDNFDKIHQQVRYSRLFVALHMHAGDGNVHTNIPVHSDDYAMMHSAEAIVDEVMHLAISLDGVVSGEHGIGLTKIRYLDEDKLEAFTRYKQEVDPQQVFNRGKLLAGSGLQNAYTPSLKLVQQEALILEYSDLGAINDAVKNCLRCGKCKPECMTHIPTANLLYSPRDKILATGLIVEAFLYEEQTRRGLSIRHFDELNDIADHCTTCHKCLNPCPVNIDFGDVSIAMRDILTKHRKKPFNPGSSLALLFLNIQDPTTIKVMRQLVIIPGLKAVKWLRIGLRRFGLMRSAEKQPRSTTGKPVLKQQVVNFVRHPVRAKVPPKTMRQLLLAEETDLVPVIRDPEVNQSNRDSVFYFPGCGSERLLSQVGIATLAMLYDTGTRTVLPPGYLCCGYPQTAAGQAKKGHDITTRNRVLFHRVANTLNYLDIKTVIVSCGTCLDQLEKYQFEKIFPGSRIMDIHEYLLEKGMRVEQQSEFQYTYHDPCHAPIKQYSPLEVASNIMQSPVELSNRCCGEAGTLATSRPDIARQLYSRKLQSMLEAKSRLDSTDKPVKCLTSCPACMQGLSRYEKQTGITTDYIVVELARLNYGEDWHQQFVNRINNGGIEKVLL